jgi:hypothetical protein
MNGVIVQEANVDHHPKDILGNETKTKTTDSSEELVYLFPGMRYQEDRRCFSSAIGESKIFPKKSYDSGINLENPIRTSKASRSRKGKLEKKKR